MLGILIALHELGHFIAAKAFNVYVFEFAVGMGPKVIQKKGKETKYTSGVSNWWICCDDG